MSSRAVSALILWLLAPMFLWLSLHRPFGEGSGRAARLPRRLGEFSMVAEHPLTARHVELLGTDDATWRTYRAASGAEIYLVALYHDSNWKSVHPPHICLRGSDMVILQDETTPAIPLADGSEVVAGRIVTAANGQPPRRYLSLFLFGARGFRTPSYGDFVLHHLPRALLRQSQEGYLLRVETWMDDGADAAAGRCRRFLELLVPAAEAGLVGG